MNNFASNRGLEDLASLLTFNQWMGLYTFILSLLYYGHLKGKAIRKRKGLQTHDWVDISEASMGDALGQFVVDHARLINSMMTALESFKTTVMKVTDDFEVTLEDNKEMLKSINQLIYEKDNLLIRRGENAALQALTDKLDEIKEETIRVEKIKNQKLAAGWIHHIDLDGEETVAPVRSQEERPQFALAADKLRTEWGKYQKTDGLVEIEIVKQIRSGPLSYLGRIPGSVKYVQSRQNVESLESTTEGLILTPKGRNIIKGRIIFTHLEDHNGATYIRRGDAIHLNDRLTQLWRSFKQILNVTTRELLDQNGIRDCRQETIKEKYWKMVDGNFDIGVD